MRHGIPARQIAFCSNQKTSFDTPDLWIHFFGEVALETIITNAIKIPGVKVDRDKFLA